MFASRGEDCFKSQLGILLTAVFVLSSRWAVSEELSRAVCLLFRRCVPPSSEACCGVEMKSEQASLFTLSAIAGRRPSQWTIPLTEALLGDLFILPVSCYKFKASSHRKESSLSAASIHFSCYLWEKRVWRMLHRTWETLPPWGWRRPALLLLRIHSSTAWQSGQGGGLLGRRGEYHASALSAMTVSVAQAALVSIKCRYLIFTIRNIQYFSW